MTKKFFTLFFALVASVGTMFAWDYERVKIGDLYYNLDATNQTAEVTYKSYTNYNYNEGWGITTANIPASVEFYDGVGYSVTSIGDRAFYDCTGLTSVTISNSVTSIGDWAFNDCTGLTSVTIPNSVTSIGEDAFLYCFGLTSVHISDIAAWCAISFGKYNANPLSYAHNLYLNGELVTDLVIPNSVKSIGDEAFSGCSGLTSVTIPNSVKSIGDEAFAGCESLTAITIPNSVTSIGDGAFRNCSGLTSINVETNNPYYCSVEGVLFNKDKTRLIQYPEGKQGAYTIPNSVTSIEYGAFSYCSGLTSVTIPNSVTSIEYGAFSYCSGLKSVTIPNSVTSIGEYAFSYCSGLKSVTIPNSVTSIGEYAFLDCDGLTSISVAMGNTVYDSRNNCNAIIETATNTLMSGCQKTIIPNSVTSIGDAAFYKCKGLTSITIPNSVTSIGDWAFGYCSGLTSVTIGNSVTSIGEYAFYNCSGLTSVTIEAETPPTLGENAFDYDFPIYVPCNAVNAYKTAWSEYADRIVANCASYTITFVNWDGNELLKLTGVENGTMPVYTGNTPTRPDDAFYTYTFKGWSPNIVAATEDATYVAVYDEHPRTTDIKEVNAEANVVRILRNGQLYILRNGKAYSVQGQEVK